MWGYGLYNFTVSQHIIRQQSYARQEASLKAKFIEEYFKQKYGLENASKNEFNEVINNLEETWQKIESELIISEEKKINKI